MTESTFKTVVPLAVGEAKTSLPYLALGMIVSYLRHRQSQGQLPGYDIRRISPAGCMGRPLEQVVNEAVLEGDPVYLLSSYVWNHELNLSAARTIKQRWPRSLVIMGGPHVPKYEADTRAFLAAHEFIDVAVVGEGEVTLFELLTALRHAQPGDLSSLSAVNGIAFMGADGFVQTSARDKMKEIAELPSPYLSGEFEPWFRDFEVTVLETNRGCPYGCTYCDWGSATLSRVSKFTAERVIDEVEYLARQSAETIFIADANFGMLEQDIEIAQGLVDVKARYGFPRRIMTNFAKNGGRRLMKVIQILHTGGLLPIGIIALQTTDSEVLKTIERDNIKTESFEKMMHYFNSQNIPMASDLMIGLPGQTVESFVGDLQYCFDWKVSANGNYTSMMPNAPMAESSYREAHGIVTDGNNMIASTRTFSTDDLDYMKKLYTAYLFHVKFGVLKYILIYLQVEHKLPAIEVLRRWLDCVLALTNDLLISARLMQDVFSRSVHTDWAMLIWRDNADFLFNDVEAYYREFLNFVAAEFHILMDASLQESLIGAQQAVMPRAGRHYPYRIELQYDVGAYIAQVKEVACLDELGDHFTPLSRFPQGELRVTSEYHVMPDNRFLEPGTHADAWELPSPLRFY